MKYWRGYLTAAVLAAITWALMELGTKFGTLVDMIYPYVIRTAQTMLANWSGSVEFVLWQVLLIVAAIVLLATLVLMIVLKWNPIQWFGWVLAAVAGVFMLNTLVFGLNHYAGPMAEDIRLEVVDYNLDELTKPPFSTGTRPMNWQARSAGMAAAMWPLPPLLPWQSRPPTALTQWSMNGPSRYLPVPPFR